jgi:hypothetical protein
MDVLSAMTAFGAAATVFTVVVAIGIFVPGCAVEIGRRRKDEM